MRRSLNSGRSARRARRAVRLSIEPLESRALPSATAAPTLPLTELQPDDTLDQAQDLGALDVGTRVTATGAIGDSPAGAADVDWYQIALDQPARLTLKAVAPTGDAPAPVVLSLYDTDPFNFADPYERLGHRQIAQDDATGDGVVEIDRPLAAGTYFVAVSGAGNRYFHPFLAASGYAGQTGPYELIAAAGDPGLGADSGPVVLTADPASGAVLDRSPAFLRVYLSAPIDVNANPLDQTVQLTYSPDGTFDGSETDVALADSEFSSDTSEILLTPAASLAPGYYHLHLSAAVPSTDPSAGPGLAQDWGATFQVAGVEGNTAADAGADDTPATAHQFGDVTTAGLVQAAGAIGDDPTAPPTVRPASDVDLYHFHVSGPGHYALTAEVFAGRIGSPLNPALSLFEQDPETGLLRLVAANDNTLNGVEASDQNSLPLRLDPVLNVGLSEGDYFVAVSSSKNVPDPARGILPGDAVPFVGQIFDPNVSHSGTAGSTTGSYVLNLLVQPEAQPPQALAVTPGAGANLDAPPARLSVRFSEPVNVQQLAYQAFTLTSSGVLPAVYVQAADGTRYSPRFEGFDPATNEASFLMLDALPDGAYELHLSGPLGLADFAGNPLAGNSAGGDYVTRFTVNGPARGTAGDPLSWVYADSEQGPVHQQSLGTLFPAELAQGVTVTRSPLPAGASGRPQQADSYEFEVLQGQQYIFLLSGDALPPAAGLTLLDASGAEVPTQVQEDGVSRLAYLQAGTYRAVIQGWTDDESAGVGYQLTLRLAGAADTPVPLTSGPVPAIRLRLDSVSTSGPSGQPGSGPGSPAGGSPGNPGPASPGGTPSPVSSSPPAVGTTGPEGDGSGQGAIAPPPRLVLASVPPTPDPSPPVLPFSLVSFGDQVGPASSPAGPARGPSPGPVANASALASTPGQAAPQGAAQPVRINQPLSLTAALGTNPVEPLLGTIAPGARPPVPRLTLQDPDRSIPEGFWQLLVCPSPGAVGGEERAESAESASPASDTGPTASPARGADPSLWLRWWGNWSLLEVGGPEESGAAQTEASALSGNAVAPADVAAVWEGWSGETAEAADHGWALPLVAFGLVLPCDLGRRPRPALWAEGTRGARA